MVQNRVPGGKPNTLKSGAKRPADQGKSQKKWAWLRTTPEPPLGGWRSRTAIPAWGPYRENLNAPELMQQMDHLTPVFNMYIIKH